jgi:hypothetical protein
VQFHHGYDGLVHEYQYHLRISFVSTNLVNHFVQIVVFQEYKTGKFVGQKVSTCLSSIECPAATEKESAKLAPSMKVLMSRFRQD